jgi:hypothetical protein
MIALARAEPRDLEVDGRPRTNVGKYAHQHLRAVGSLRNTKGTCKIRRPSEIDLGTINGEDPPAAPPAAWRIRISPVLCRGERVEQVTERIPVESLAGLTDGRCTHGRIGGQGQPVVGSVVPKVRYQMTDTSTVSVGDHIEHKGDEKLWREHPATRERVRPSSEPGLWNSLERLRYDSVNFIASGGGGTIFSGWFSCSLAWFP